MFSFTSGPTSAYGSSQQERSASACARPDPEACASSAQGGQSKKHFLGIIAKQLAARFLWLATKDKIAHFGCFFSFKIAYLVLDLNSKIEIVAVFSMM